MSLYDADRQAERLLAAVEGLPPAHDCPGLAHCFNHPGWHVWKSQAARRWWAINDSKEYAKRFPTHAEAIRFAASCARAEQLAAITHSEGADALPTPDLETP